MLTESTLNLFRKNTNIITEMLHLPHGTTNAKVICHVDLDGVCSGISMVQQLIKQGIKKERIQVEFAQYGDEDKQKRNFNKIFQKKNKQQWVGVTDFAKYPKGKPWEEFNKLMDFKGKKYQLVSFMNSRDFSKINNEDSFADIFKKTFTIKDNKFTKGGLEKMYDICKAYSLWGKKKEPVTEANIEKYSLQLVRPDFGSDHHSNENGSLSAAERGDLAVKSPSEAEFFANKYAPGLWSQDDLKAISMVDSADYTREELENTIFLQKKFTGPNRKRNLANLTGILYDTLCKKDEKAAKWIILNSQPSLVSLYNTIKQASKLNGERLRMLEAIKNGDYKTGKEIAETLPKILNKNWYDKNSDTYKDRNGKAIGKAETLERYSEKNQKDLLAVKSGYKNKEDEETLKKLKNKRDNVSKELRDRINSKEGKIFHFNNFSIFNGTNPKIQYGRYMAGLASKDGIRQPYIMRRWNNMFQISLNTLYKRGCIEAGITEDIVDFSKVNEKVLEEIRKFLASKGMSKFNVDRVIDYMKEKNGGHKGGIWTFNGFDKIKPTSSQLGSYWQDREKMDRANRIDARRTGKSATTMKGKIEVMKKILKNSDAADRLSEKENGIIKQWKEIAKEAQERAMNAAIKYTNMLYPPRKEGLEALKNDDKRFEIER